MWGPSSDIDYNRLITLIVQNPIRDIWEPSVQFPGWYVGDRKIPFDQLVTLCRVGLLNAELSPTGWINGFRLTAEIWLEYWSMGWITQKEKHPEMDDKIAAEGRQAQAEAYDRGYPTLTVPERTPGAGWQAEIYRKRHWQRYDRFTRDCAEYGLDDSFVQIVSKFGARFHEWTSAALWNRYRNHVYLWSDTLDKCEFRLPDEPDEFFRVEFFCKKGLTRETHKFGNPRLTLLKLTEWSWVEQKCSCGLRHKLVIDPFIMIKVKETYANLAGVPRKEGARVWGERDLAKRLVFKTATVKA